MLRKNAREKKLRTPKASRGLKVLRALANGTLEFGAAFVELAAQGYPSVSKSLWRQAHDKSIRAPTIDLEKLIVDRKERARYRRAVLSLRERRFVRVVVHRGKRILIITEEGKRRLRSAELSDVSIIVPKKWDKRWRIVLFDIPEKRKHSRDVFRRHLQRLGFFQFQKSSFVLPYPCADELDVIIQQLDIVKFVTFFETNSLGYQEAKALNYFKIKR